MSLIELAMAADKLSRTMARLSRRAEAHPIGPSSRPDAMKSLLAEAAMAVGEFENALTKGSRK